MLSLNWSISQSELLYADDLVLIGDTIEELWNKFLKWKEAFESKGLTVDLEKKASASHRMACLKVKLTHLGSEA